jgi:hypothetical protein
MIAELFRRWLYVSGVRTVRKMSGAKVHYATIYRNEYLQGPRWYLMRQIRLWLDGHRGKALVYPEHGQPYRCGMRTTLQIHHKSYQHKGKSFIGELFDCETRCDAHHSKDS